ncbi:MAG: DNA recombination protein RmuC [Alphaproteobacteria bacterium]
MIEVFAIGVGVVAIILLGVVIALQMRARPTTTPEVDDVSPLREQVARLEAERDGLMKSVEQLGADLSKAEHAHTELSGHASSVREKLAATEQALKNAEQRVVEIQESRDELRREFKAASAESAKTQGQVLQSQNKEQMDLILKPLKEQIAKFEGELKSAHKDAGQERAVLKEQIETLGSVSQSMAVEAQGLTRALRADSQKQGAWGEMVLARILEASGLREGIEYTTQQSVTMDDGSRLRPDVVINMPNGQKVVVDSKVSLTAFYDLENATDGDDADRALKSHVRSIEGHVKGLGSKDYRKAAGSDLDYVIMFLPIEGAWAAALRERQDLPIWTMDQGVTICPPSNLLAILRTINTLWDVERRNKNAEEIAARAGDLYDKFVGFVETFKTARKQLGSAINNLDKAEDQLVDGRGNVVRRIEQLRDMGVAPKKQLPPEMTERAIETDDAPVLIDNPDKQD